ncbi:MAG: GTPase Era [Rickettsiales bacterium]|jgi:GTP-binding protein Era|nr:GTPase Era [Rickettsiales bacterium]
MEKKTLSGFVAIIGPTNAGKSALLNAIMGRKVSIVSHKVQTTRTQLRAVKMIGDAQLILVDTPGIFRPARTLDRAMVKSALDSLADADAVLLLIDANHGITGTISEIVKKLNGKNIFAAINKVDAVKKEHLLPLAKELSDFGVFQEIFMISALKNKGIGEMLDALAKAMPESPYLFDPKDSVGVPDALWLAEITREKIYRFIHQELPYHIHVSTDKMETDGEGVVEIAQTIYVKTDGHKKIIIGRGGEQLKKIGTLARREIQDEWGVNARLKLFVRVEDWENNAEHYSEQGLAYVKQ